MINRVPDNSRPYKYGSMILLHRRHRYARYGPVRVAVRVRPQKHPMFIGLGTAVRLKYPKGHPLAAPKSDEGGPPTVNPNLDLNLGRNLNPVIPVLLQYHPVSPSST